MTTVLSGTATALDPLPMHVGAGQICGVDRGGPAEHIEMQPCDEAQPLCPDSLTIMVAKRRLNSGDKDVANTFNARQHPKLFFENQEVAQ